MQALSGLFFSLSLVLAVVLGGQTLDYTWGPALVALAISLATGGAESWRLGKQPKSAWLAFAFILAASGWLLWRGWGSPVREFGRSDSLLVAAALVACVWAWMMPARGRALRFAMAALALLGVTNLAIALIQLGDPAFAWPFGNRPAKFPSGLFGHYNHLADFSLVSAVLLVARSVWARDGLLERILQGAGAAAAAACVALSASRGGALSLGAGLAVLFLAWGILAWRDKRRNRGVIAGLAVVLPVLIALLAPLVFNRIQERRGSTAPSVIRAADDRFRLTMASYAIDISTTQPWTGSGSRSFGWKKNTAADPDHDKVWERFNDDFVHNELLQAAVDYGWGGALLIVAAVLATGLAGVAGLAGREETDPHERGALDALTCGGMAAMAGTLFHSNFSFVSHTLPGAIYLGLAFGLALPKRTTSRLADSRGISRFAPCLVLLPVAAVLAAAGWQATQAYRALWPVFFGKDGFAAAAPELAMERIAGAMDRWPGSELAGKGAHLCRATAQTADLPAADRADWSQRAVDLYAKAAALNPYDPEWPVNRANLLSAMGRHDEAEREFERAIELQGGTERNFRARYYLASHLYRRWYDAWIKERRAGEALGQFLRARDLLREADRQGGLGQLGQESKDLVKGLDETIRFLEGAQVRPEPVRGK